MIKFCETYVQEQFFDIEYYTAKGMLAGKLLQKRDYPKWKIII
jgi:hypothetical protein